MSTLFDEHDYDAIAEACFDPKWPGYTPSVVESGNGDGVWDEQKQYAHVAPKYFNGPTDDNLELRIFYGRAVEHARKACVSLGIDESLVGPDSTMRVLHYPAGAGAAQHTDFCLFTLRLYRSTDLGFMYLGYDSPGWGAAVSVTHEHHRSARRRFPGIHFGEIWRELIGHYADRHEVFPISEPSQSIVFFVVPPHETVLPSGVTVGDWLKERKERSRKER